MQTQVIKKYSGKLADYTELRAQENRTLGIQFLNGQMVANSSSTESGISARNFIKGIWGFASHPQISEASAERVLAESLRNAQFLSQKAKSQGAQLKIPGARYRLDLSTKKSHWSSAEIIDRVKAYDQYLLTTYPDLSSRSLRVTQQDFIKEGINSEGAETYTHYARSYLIVSLGLPSDSGQVELRKVMGNKGQIEDTFPSFETFKESVAELYEHLKDKSKGIMAEGGLKDVIMSSELAGILAHEAIGHTTEADLVLAGSVAGGALGKMVASPLVSLVDYAHTVFGEEAPMPVYFDDEGTSAEDTVIIENGLLKTYMNSKETALHFEQKATGHARAWGFNDEPLIRMRNTAIVPGKSKLEDMIASIDDGYFLMDHSNGQADSTSEFMFGVPMGYEIKKGKLGRAIRDTTISGVAFDMLKTVSMLSDEMTWVSAGTCGKKQPMTVGMGGPAVKCKVHMGGK
jgi:TldD protein